MGLIRQKVEELESALQTESIGSGDIETLMVKMPRLAKQLQARARGIAKATLRPGMRVRFKTRDGLVKTGQVTKVNRKTANVRVDGDYREWRVALTLLEMEE